MVVDQDIDALLIGALYGELTPAEEAKLQTHFESHPGDKSVLADLTATRSAVRESRFLTVQIEPPQAVSALLLQEASRRRVVTPKEQPAKEGGGWFARFVRSFAAHPAMAAAAMLVVVLGVAGTVYLKNGGKQQFVDQTTSNREEVATPAAAGSDRPVTATADAEGTKLEAQRLQDNAGSGFEADLAVAGDTGEADDSAVAQKTKGKDAVAVAKNDVANMPVPKPATRPQHRTYIGTERQNFEPKDLDEVVGKKRRAPASSSDGYTISSKPGSGSRGAAGAPPPPSVDGRYRAPDTAPAMPSRHATPRRPAKAPAQAQIASDRAPAPSPARDDDSADMGISANFAKEEKNDKAAADLRWARNQHVKVAAAVRARNCKQASVLALALSNRAPAYYARNVQNDRNLKQCITYINAEREREAERMARRRALKRQADEEAASAKKAKAAAPASRK